MVNREAERKRLVELLSQFERTCPENCTGLEKSCTQCVLEQKADYLLDNGIVVPPVKVGQTVYRLDEFVWKSDCKECEHYDEGWHDCPNMCEKTGSTKKSPECIEIKEESITYEDILRYLHWKEFGKTVFISREDAVKALEGNVPDTNVGKKGGAE